MIINRIGAYNAAQVFGRKKSEDPATKKYKDELLKQARR